MRKLVSLLFGPGHIPPEQVFFDRPGSDRHLAFALFATGYMSLRGFYEGHSLRALALPFLLAHNNLEPFGTFTSQSDRFYREFGMAQTLFRPSPAFSLECVL